MIDPTGKTYLYGEIPKQEETEEIVPEYASQPYLYGEILDKAQWVEGEGDPPSQTFLYGEVCARAERMKYYGSTTDSAETIVNATTIEVNVNKNFVAAEANRAVLDLDLTNKVKVQISQETERAMLAEADLQRQIDELKSLLQQGSE